MSVRAVDGTLEAVTVKRRASKAWRLADMRIRRADGGDDTPKVVVATPKVGAELTPGASGRFYLYKAVDHWGIHAVRLADGRLVAEFPRTNETLMAVLFVLNLVMLGAMLALEVGLFWLTIALIPFTAVLWFLYRQTRLEAEAQLAAEAAPQ